MADRLPLAPCALGASLNSATVAELATPIVCGAANNQLAHPTIGAVLHIPPARLGWIQTGYLMAEVIAIPLTGLLTRAFSLRWMLRQLRYSCSLNPIPS